MISAKTAYDIAVAYQEIENAEKLLADISETIERERRGERADIRDAFGRSRNGLELGVPSGSNGRRLFHVPWPLARPVIETHVASMRAELQVLNEKARAEIDAPLPAKTSEANDGN